MRSENGSSHVTTEALPGGYSFLLRFHLDKNEIPGDVYANCVISSDDGYTAEVKAWGGRDGPTVKDKNTIKDFCETRFYTEVFWVRYKKNKQPKVIWLYQKIAH